MHTWKRIKAARKAAGLTQDEIAQRLNVSRAAVSQWEKEGGTLPTHENLVKFARATGADLATLLNGSPALVESRHPYGLSAEEQLALALLASLTPSQRAAWFKWAEDRARENLEVLAHHSK